MAKEDKNLLLSMAATLWAGGRDTGMTAKDAVLGAKQLFKAAEDEEQAEEQRAKDQKAAEQKKEADQHAQDTPMHGR